MSDDAKRAWLQRMLGLDAPAAEPGAGAAAGSPEPSALDTMRARLERLEPDYLRILATDPATRTQMSATMAFAQERLDDGDPARAGAALDRLERLMAAPAGPAQAAPRPMVQASGDSLYDTVRGEGRLVAYRKALLEWEAARKEAGSEVDRLKAFIKADHPALASAASLLDGVMARLNDDLSDALDAAISADGMAARTRTHAAAADLARAYLMRVSFDPVFHALDRNPVTPLRTRDILGKALKSLVAALPA